jgi:phosphatidylglycerophosphatase C
MAQAMAWHRAQGHRLILVSASLAIYLGPFARASGFDLVIATRLSTDDDGRLTGRLEGANVRGPEKARLLTAALGDQPVELWAYGDSAGDRQMLAMADHPHRVGRRRNAALVPISADGA